MDLVGDIDYDSWGALLEKLDQGADEPISSTQSHSIPSFSLGSPDSGFDLASAPPDPYQYANSKDAPWLALPDSSMLVGADVAQPYKGVDWGGTFQMDETNEGVSTLEDAPGRLQLSASPPDVGRPPAQMLWNTGTRDTVSVSLASLPTIGTTVEPFDSQGFYGLDQSTDNPSTPLAQETDQSIYANPLSLRDQPLPSSTVAAIEPMSWQDFQLMPETTFPPGPPGLRDVPSLSPEPIPEGSSKKRKPPLDTTPTTSSRGQGKSAEKKKTHSAVEKRYRRNLNAKMAALKDCVPSLRAVSQGNLGSDGESGDPEDLMAPKLNKSTVLSKAVEYIQQLERRNSRLTHQCETQGTQLNAFQRLDAAGRIGGSSDFTGDQNSLFDVDLGGDLRIRQTIGMAQFQQPQQQARELAGQSALSPRRSPPRIQSHGGGRKVSGGALSKLMVGSMGCMMFAEGFRERGRDGETPAGRGLFALPLEVIHGFRHLLARPGGGTLAGVLGSPSSADLLLLVKVVLIIGAVVYILSPSFFDPAPKGMKESIPAPSVTAVPSSGVSPVVVRRKAWLTAIQTIQFPRHSFLREPVTLVMVFLSYCLRFAVGADTYARFAGTTKEQESARVKAWEVALDAQLTGGDVDMSKTRLALSLMASLSLPGTPARLMLRALHIRVLLMDSGYVLKRISTRLARHYWNEARALYTITTGDASAAVGIAIDLESLPPHLATLLGMDCDNVMLDDTLRRVHNLVWGRPTSEGMQGMDEGMNAVVEDFSIRTPLDALAAWWSSFALHRGLIGHLEVTGIETKEKENTEVNRCIRDAIRVAPPTSGAHLRALVARAVLSPPDSSQNSLSSALKALPNCEIYRVQASKLVARSAASVVTMAGIRVAVRCAMALVSLHHSAAPDGGRPAAIKFLKDLSPAGGDDDRGSSASHLGTRIGLLGFVAAWKTLNVFAADEALQLAAREVVEGVALGLRVWMGGERGRRCGLGRAERTRIVDACLEVGKRVLTAGAEGEVGGDEGGKGGE
ncbi:MAG: hypothetical protein M1813_008566 [Trichoglossum hirsutum]|nr:MAG: hypothetical protein M1813_008566 [Trichoglossum hirsutum]